MNLFSSSLTLSGRTRREIKEGDEFLYDLYKSKKRQELRVRMNSLRFAMISVSVAFCFGLACCFIPREIIDTYLGFLGLFFFSGDGAKEMISDILASSATIIGLSFVVIGFSFEVVKNASNQTLRSIFRETKLHFVFSISIVSILFLVVMTSLKHTVNQYIVGNFAIFSCWLLILTTVAIAYMFAKVITFFNQEKISRMSREYFARLATFAFVDFEYTRISEEHYGSYLQSRGFTRHISFTSDGEGQTVLRYANQKNAEIVDICLPLVASLVARIGKRSGEDMPKYQLLRHKLQLKPAQGLFYFDQSSEIKWIENKLVNFCFHTRELSSSMEEFAQQKAEIQESLILAGDQGDIKQVRARLEDIRSLYEKFRS
ncbi:hypothetical protein ACTJKN_25755 [Pedobacter sp. 22163]|uniref:hypothetical protein n=1 Tax=Pedobacter sp. 22163 TaxID=3453883 RepID=UPI003F87AA32